MNTLLVAPHPDDADIAASTFLGGAALLVMTDPSPERREEQRRAADLHGAELLFGGHPDGRLACGRETIRTIESAIEKYSPDIVLVPPERDSHQDHRATRQAAASALRRNLSTALIEYETSSSLPDWQPNLWNPMSETDYRKHLLGIAAHDSQAAAPYMRRAWHDARSRWRGEQIGAERAQAFRLIRGSFTAMRGR